MHRWVSVVYPLRYRKFVNNRLSKHIIIGIILSCNLLPALYNVLSVFLKLITFEFDPYIPNCVFRSNNSSNSGVIISIVLFIAVPLLVNTYTNVFMLNNVAKLKGLSRKRLLRSTKTVVATVYIYYLFWLSTAVRLAMAILKPHN